MKMTSPEFEDNTFIPFRYTCEGDNINPPLRIEDIPEGAKSLALLVDDPDAPVGIWDHWVVWNIDPSISVIKEGFLPEGAMKGLNSSKQREYVGPCPPSGTHRYYFKLYALDAVLNLGHDSRKEDVERAMEGHVLDWVSLVGLYKRQLKKMGE